MTLGDCKLRIVSHFDQIISDIDYKTEHELGKAFLDEGETETLNNRRELFINHIKQVQHSNLLNLDRTYNATEFESLDENELNKKLFSKFCLFVNQNMMSKQSECFADELFGRLVIVDQHLSEETLAAFTDLLRYNKKSCVIPLANKLFEFKAEVNGL